MKRSNRDLRAIDRWQKKLDARAGKKRAAETLKRREYKDAALSTATTPDVSTWEVIFEDGTHQPIEVTCSKCGQKLTENWLHREPCGSASSTGGMCFGY